MAGTIISIEKGLLVPPAKKVKEKFELGQKRETKMS